MATLTAPGVYVDEVSSGVRPIAAAGTSTAAFFGEAERGPNDRVVKVFNFTEFQTYYGDFLTGSRFLAHSVYQFFNNGGNACYIGRIAPGAVTADVTVQDRAVAAANTLQFLASSPGEWGNSLMLVVDSGASTDPSNRFNLTVFRENPAGGDPIALESFADLSMDPNDAGYVETVINTQSVYLRVDDLESGNVIQGFSESSEIVVDGADLLGSLRQFRININNDGIRTVDLTDEITNNAPDLTDPTAVATTIAAVVNGLSPLRGTTDPAAYSGALVQFTVTDGGPNGVLRITAGGAAGPESRVEVLNAIDPATNAAGALGLGLSNGGIEVHGSSEQRPQNTPAEDYYLVGDDTIAGAVTAVTAGTNGTTPPQDLDYINAFSLLDTIRDVSLMAVPGIGSEAVADAGMNYCSNRELRDIFFIADMEAADDTYPEAIAYRDAINNPNSFGAVYYPWLYMLDPTGASSEPIAAPPSGFVAGLYSRTDSRRGVWKSPAGTEAILAGTVGLVTDITNGQQGDLNNHPKAVNVIRKFPTTGIVAWGARTLSSDPENKYVSVRRMQIFLRVSIFNGIQWAVFEPNDEPLWSQLRLNIGSFMNTLFRQGAFQGATPSEAYFVKCDSETTTQADIDNGIVNVLVGFAPLKPAEFVVVRISQLAGQTS